MNRTILVILLFFLSTIGVTAKEAVPTPETPELKEARVAVVRAREEAEKAKDAWDKRKLEATLWQQRDQRAYQQWAKAKKADRPAALKRRQETGADLKIAVESRRAAWYRYELAKQKVRLAEDRLEIVRTETELRRVQERLQALRSERTVTPSRTPAATPAP